MFGEVIQKIKEAKKIGIFNHVNPDGDAHGSAFALMLTLRKIGKEAQVFLRRGDDLTKEYKLLKGELSSDLKLQDCDLFIAVDCADLGRLGEYSEAFCGNTACIDHHITHKNFAEATVVVGNAPATGEIIYDLVEELGVEMDADIAYNLYMAIVCDTGNFKYSSTTPKTHRVAAKLLENNVDFADMTKRLFDTKSINYLRLQKSAIEKLETYKGGKITLLLLMDEDFEKEGISEADADSIVTLPGSVEGAEIGVYIRQRGEGFKVSLRSNGLVDVSKVAVQFGGGGHERAAGFNLDMTPDMAKITVVDALSKALDGYTEK